MAGRRGGSAQAWGIARARAADVVTAQVVTSPPRKAQDRFEDAAVAAIVEHMKMMGGWSVHHNPDSQLVEAGLPDVIAAGWGCQIVWEVKVRGDNGRKPGSVRPAQADWLRRLREAGVDARVVYAEDRHALCEELTQIKRAWLAAHR